jgi:hypothetical protein
VCLCGWVWEWRHPLPLSWSPRPLLSVSGCLQWSGSGPLISGWLWGWGEGPAPPPPPQAAARLCLLSGQGLPRTASAQPDVQRLEEASGPRPVRASAWPDRTLFHREAPLPVPSAWPRRSGCGALGPSRIPGMGWSLSFREAFPPPAPAPSPSWRPLSSLLEEGLGKMAKPGYTHTHTHTHTHTATHTLLHCHIHIVMHIHHCVYPSLLSLMPARVPAPSQGPAPHTTLEPEAVLGRKGPASKNCGKGWRVVGGGGRRRDPKTIVRT